MLKESDLYRLDWSLYITTANELSWCSIIFINKSWGDIVQLKADYSQVENLNWDTLLSLTLAITKTLRLFLIISEDILKFCNNTNLINDRCSQLFQFQNLFFFKNFQLIKLFALMCRDCRWRDASLWFHCWWKLWNWVISLTLKLSISWGVLALALMQGLD